jgi:hypothetical protein
MYKLIDRWSNFIVNESLKTGDIDKTIKNILDELSMARIDFNIIKLENNTIQLELKNFNYIKGHEYHLDYINNLFIDRWGWFPTKMEILNFSGMTMKFPYNEEMLKGEQNIYFLNVKIIYESKYDIQIDSPPNRVYHLSINSYKSDILKRGLIPKSKSKLSKHLDRIYLCINPSDCYNLINGMKFYYKSRLLNNKRDKLDISWIIYEIDLDKLDIKLYRDPNYNGGWYIVENIPPDRIKLFDCEK